MIFGPPQQPINKMSSLNTSIASVYELISGSRKMQATAFPVGVDVRDVAALHVKAVSSKPNNPENAQRFLSIAWHYFNHEIADIIANSAKLAEIDQNIKSRVTADRSDDPVFEHYTTNVVATEEFLGRPFIDKETSIVETTARLLELEKNLSQ